MYLCQFSMGLDFDHMAILKQECILLYQLTSDSKVIHNFELRLGVKLSVLTSKLLIFD